MGNSPKRYLIQLFIISAIALLIVGGYIYDKRYADAMSISLQIDPNPAPADGVTDVRITVTVLDPTRAPRKGDVIFILPGFGRITPYRGVTDENGQVRFTYRMWTAGLVHGAEDTWFRVTDESNSRFIGVPARAEATLKVFEPVDKVSSESRMTVESMFAQEEEEK